ncbi:MAG: uridine kinase [Bacteroidia bacterium]|nr:uridine kinase [Bacteroidia bacterium]
MSAPYVIGITGGSGSGKTSLIRTLKSYFKDQSVGFLSQDDYYIPREQQVYDDKGVQNFDLPSSIDIEGFIKDIQKLITGETVTRMEYVFNNEKATPKMLTFKPGKVIIVEGLFILHVPELVELLDLSIFVHARDDQKISRRIVRDQIERNYPLEDVLYRYEHHVMPSYLNYILPYKDSADLVINNNITYDHALAVINSFIERKLTED